VYASERARLRFRRVKAPEKAELESLVHTVSERVGRYLERQGLLVRDLDNSYLALEPRDEADREQVLGSSSTDRIAIGALTKAARPLPCRPCQRKASWRRTAHGWRKRPVSLCMAVWRRGPMNARSWRDSNQTTSFSERARWRSTATVTLAVHPWYSETVGVLHRHGEKAVRIERENGIRRIVPVSWTSLVPRVARRLCDGRAVRIGPEVALELARWVSPRLARGGAGK